MFFLLIIRPPTRSTRPYTRFPYTTLVRSIAGLEQVGGFGGKAVALAEGELYMNDPDFYKKRLDMLAKATPAAVTAAMQKWLRRPVYSLRVVPGEDRKSTRMNSSH